MQRVRVGIAGLLVALFGLFVARALVDRAWVSAAIFGGFLVVAVAMLGLRLRTGQPYPFSATVLTLFSKREREAIKERSLKE
jgi:hypothetical protein